MRSYWLIGAGMILATSLLLARSGSSYTKKETSLDCILKVAEVHNICGCTVCAISPRGRHIRCRGCGLSF
jgi:hypothetical protein